MPTKAKYIYGIVPNQFITERLKSLGNRAIYAISFQSLSAIVSDQDNLDIDFTNSELLGHLLVHHQKTIEYLVENGVSTIVPMRIGTVVGSTEEVIQILSNGYDLMLDILKKVEDLTEIDIAVTWADFSSVIGEIAGHPEIIAMKNEILNNPESPSAANQVMIGMLVQEKLREKNKQVELRILDALSNFSEEIKKHETMNDQMVTNSAILIRKNKDLVLEQMIDLLDEEFSGNLKFKLVGPIPC